MCLVVVYSLVVVTSSVDGHTHGGVHSPVFGVDDFRDLLVRVCIVATQHPGSSSPTSLFKRWSSDVVWMCSASFNISSFLLLAWSTMAVSFHAIG